ncbi:hypothetical protein ZTR_10894 [Talaromyces verruculosus]|nr:hypothetical protein ZTR_10894 [Talaromyces verruculosus]
MKTKAQPATVQEVDHNDHPILHSTKSAKRISKANSGSTLPQRTRMPYAFNFERQTPTAVIYGEFKIEAVNEMRFRDVNFGKYLAQVDMDLDAWQVTFVGLTAFIRENDKKFPDPKIYVEQSMIRDGHEEILIHELTFGGQVQTGIDYIFRGIGDEHPDFGKRDLKVRLLSVNDESFDTYMTGAGYYGYDRTEYAIMNREMLDRGQAYSLKKSSWGNDSYQHSVTFDPADVRILLNAKREKEKEKNQGVSSELELFNLCMHKALPSEDGTAVGDLNLRVVYKS